MRRIATLFGVRTAALMVSLHVGGAAAADAPMPADLANGIAEILAQREYEATPRARGLQAPNRAHGLRTWFEPTGIRVHERTAEGSPELLSLTLSGVGRDGMLAPVAPGEVVHAGASMPCLLYTSPSPRD